MQQGQACRDYFISKKDVYNLLQVKAEVATCLVEGGDMAELHQCHQLFYSRKSLIIGLPVWRTRAGANTLTVQDCVIYFHKQRAKGGSSEICQ